MLKAEFAYSPVNFNEQTLSAMIKRAAEQAVLSISQEAPGRGGLKAAISYRMTQKFSALIFIHGTRPSTHPKELPYSYEKIGYVHEKGMTIKAKGILPMVWKGIDGEWHKAKRVKMESNIGWWSRGIHKAISDIRRKFGMIPLVRKG